MHREGWIHSVNFRGMDTQCGFQGMNSQYEFREVDIHSVDFKG